MGVAVANEGAAVAICVVRIGTSSGEERRREAARHTGLMKAAFGRETDEAIENARIYEEGEGRALLWGAEAAAAAAEAARRAAEMAEADADGAQAGNEEAREAAEIAEEAAEAAEAEEAADPDGAAALHRPPRRRPSRS